MMEISKFRDEIENLILDNEFINIKISIGNINKNRIMNKNIYNSNFDIFEKFVEKRTKKKMKENIKEYKYKDMTCLSYDNIKKVCYRSLLTTFKDFKIRTKNRCLQNLRVEVINRRVIDPINFPALEKYDYIENYYKNSYFSKFKNSEIIIEFIKTNKNLLFINFITKVDNKNLDNFINSINYYLMKLHFSKSKLIV